MSQQKIKILSKEVRHKSKVRMYDLFHEVQKPGKIIYGDKNHSNGYAFGGLLIGNGYKDVFQAAGNVVCLNACI